MNSKQLLSLANQQQRVSSKAKEENKVVQRKQEPCSIADLRNTDIKNGCLLDKRTENLFRGPSQPHQKITSPKDMLDSDSNSQGKIFTIGKRSMRLLRVIAVSS